MPTRLKIHPSDLRGAARLAVGATTGVTDIVEAMHERIARVPLPGRAAPEGRVGGIGGLVYGSVRGITRLVGGSVDALLALVERALPAGGTTPGREGVLAALNGVLGDHLAATGNPLALPMVLHGPEPGATAGTRVVVLVHGLCMNRLQWNRNGHDHGAALQRDLGCTPLYLHYNTGLHISSNGQALARLLEERLASGPQPPARLVLIGHSMGGLVLRSALQAASEAGLRWPAQVEDLVFLGTPHHGAPLERAGHWVDLLLGAAPYAAPLARLGKVRSAGITDLRHANLRDADWSGRDRFARGHRPAPLPLPAGPRCHAVAATTGDHIGSRRDRLLGDGLVPLDSALGRHRDPAYALAFAPDRQWIGTCMNHLDLLSSPEVYARLRDWLAEDRATAAQAAIASEK